MCCSNKKKLHDTHLKWHNIFDKLKWLNNFDKLKWHNKFDKFFSTKAASSQPKVKTRNMCFYTLQEKVAMGKKSKHTIAIATNSNVMIFSKLHGHYILLTSNTYYKKILQEYLKWGCASINEYQLSYGLVCRTNSLGEQVWAIGRSSSTFNGFVNNAFDNYLWYKALSYVFS